MILFGEKNFITDENIIDGNAYKYSNNKWNLNILCETQIDVKCFLEKYEENSALCIKETEGLFICVLENKIDKSMHIFSDISSALLDLYYTVNNNKFYFSTSLKDILKRSKISREIDEQSARVFIENGFTLGNKTLIKDIFRLESAKELVIDNNGYRINNINYTIPIVTLAESKKMLIPTMQDNIKKRIPNSDEIYMPLSAGYDSNLILDTILKTSKKHINAFTVGGSKGRNEIELVKKNIATIKQVTLHPILVDENDFQNYTDIIWRLEGSVFEMGVFLQYTLAKGLSKKGAKDVICGEYSNEILSKTYTYSMYRVIQNKIKENESILTLIDEFLTGNKIVLRKSSIMLNSFGIHGHYPFAGVNLIPYAEKLKKINGTQKYFMQKECKKLFMPQVVERLKISGGTTDSQALFSLEQYNSLKQKIDNNSFIQEIMNNYNIYYPRNYKYNKFKVLLGLTLHSLSENKIKGTIKKKKDHTLNGEINLMLKKLYLIIFKELFVSGKYDGHFNEESAPITIDDILKTI